MQEFKLILAFLTVVCTQAILTKRDIWMVDKGYNRHREQWNKYDCRRVSFYKKCSGLQGGIFQGYNESFQLFMFPTRRTQSSQFSSKGWMAQTSPLQIYFNRRLCCFGWKQVWQSYSSRYRISQSGNSM
ncbi:unnamed protein product [Cylicocyclus nassatus]|uniref:Uncharacterized protein n=1 Tax=Cylicocyclus nassatus TaxID=53992 RepID=A0AA36MDI8_CYLNA|nr:unnamed protein product [Cylicocyclus nassatus]